jgi:methyltransferase (TIGR00027 family)
MSEISHVSDTALLVAACRALESESPDGFVHDPFAARLAGERGPAMLAALARPEIMRFGVAVRSRFIDELLLDALASHPIQTVLSLGCGLDTRPWRLELPPELRWIEVDFAEMLEYKEKLMSAETPRCRRERFTANVSDATQRRAMYAAVGRKQALMITEGVLMYLPGATVDALASEVWQESGVAHWISDITSGAFSKAISMDTIQSLRNVQAPDCISGEQILDVAHGQGWTTSARRSYLTDIGFAMARIQRIMGDRPQPSGPPPVPRDDPSGIYRLARG